ncbi:MAG: hypothetical protein IPN20_23320 [Haliscomenobacter sp.]|nr:hypothetical protein [Haliscomenobacter sp.]
MVKLAFDQALPQDVGLALGALILDKHFKELQVRELLFLSGLVMLFEGLQHGRHAQVLEFVFQLLHGGTYLKVKRIKISLTKS